MLIKKCKSTKSKPLNFFEILCGTDLLIEIKNQFIPTSIELRSAYIEYEPKTETKLTITQIEDGVYEEVITFSEFYEKLINNEIFECLQSINNRIYEIHKDEKKTHFINSLTENLYYFKSIINKRNDLNKYPANLNAVNSILNEIQTRYPLNLNQYITKSFKWKCSDEVAELLSEQLHLKLMAGKFISSKTDIKIFKLAFNGSTLHKHLYIEWTAKGKNKLINFQLLFYLFFQLDSNKILFLPNVKLIDRVFNLVFCRENKNKLGKISANKSEASKTFRYNKTPKGEMYNKIDILIQELKSIAKV